MIDGLVVTLAAAAMHCSAAEVFDVVKLNLNGDRKIFAAAGIPVMVAAFLRGNHLLGLDCGVIYAAVALALLWLLARSRTSTGSVSLMRVAVVVALAVPVGYAMAFPASINPDVQVFIDKQATDRRARAELAAVFDSDQAFGDLSVSSVHLKIVNLTVRGALHTQTDLDLLRSRIAVECPTLGPCALHWEVTLRNSGQRLRGLDRDLFQEDELNATRDRDGT